MLSEDLIIAINELLFPMIILHLWWKSFSESFIGSLPFLKVNVSHVM